MRRARASLGAAASGEAEELVVVRKARWLGVARRAGAGSAPVGFEFLDNALRSQQRLPQPLGFIGARCKSSSATVAPMSNGRASIPTLEQARPSRIPLFSRQPQTRA